MTEERERHCPLKRSWLPVPAGPLLLKIECRGNVQKPYHKRSFGPGCSWLWIRRGCIGVWATFWLVGFDSRRRCARSVSRLTDVLDGRSGRNCPSSKESRLPGWLLYARGRPWQPPGGIGHSLLGAPQKLAGRSIGSKEPQSGLHELEKPLKTWGVSNRQHCRT